MKLTVLNYRINATHSLITDLGSIRDSQSISDFDAFIFDPGALTVGESQDAGSFNRRKTELRELIHVKGGVILGFLRPTGFVGVPNLPGQNTYSLLQDASGGIAKLMSDYAKLGQGSHATVIRGRHGASTEYLRVMGDDLSFEAFLQIPEENITAQNGKVLAVNSVGWPIAVEFAVEEGLVCFVPVPPGIDASRLAAAIVNTVSAHFDNPSEVEAPLWASQVEVPGANVHEQKIATLKKEREAIDGEVSALEGRRQELLSFKGLLFGYGKGVLETTVRAASRLIGFEVLDPDKYQGEWDIQLRDIATGQTAIGEIEGSDGMIDLRKFRQLYHYVGDEGLEGRDHKGLLIGNGYRLTEPAAPERAQQFSPHALRGVTKQNFCAVPCTELFRAVCNVLERPEDEDLKARIRRSILETVGLWSLTAAVIGGPQASEGQGG